MQKKGLHLSLSLIGLAFIILAVGINNYFTANQAELSKQVEANFEAKYKSCKNLIEEALTNHDSELNKHLWEAFSEQQIGVYVYNNDSLKSWNNASWPLIDSLSYLKNKCGLLTKKQGIYFYVKEQLLSKCVVALCLVKPLFEIQNNYIKNEFSNWTGLPKTVSMNESGLKDLKIMVNAQPLFSIKTTEKIFYNSLADEICLIISVFGIILILLGALIWISKNTSVPKSYAVIGLILLAKLVIIQWQWPSFFYRTSLYNLRIFGNAQSYLNGYLGDVLLNALFFLFLVIGVSFIQQKNKTSKLNWFHLLTQLTLLGMLFVQFNMNLKSIVSNSTLNFDFISVFSGNWLLLCVIVVFAVYTISVYTIFISLHHTLNTLTYVFLRINLIACLICLVYYFLFSEGYFLESFWLIFFIFILSIIYHYSQQNITISLGVAVLLISLLTSTLLNENIKRNQIIDLNILSQNLSEKKDAILESEFNFLPEKIKNDNNLINLVNLLPASERELVQRLKQIYFGGYFDRYNLDFSLFDENCNPLLPVKNQVLLNEGYFDDQIKLFADSLGNGLYFITNQNKPVQYISKIQFGRKKLFVFMEPKQFEETGSFPDLLIDQTLKKQNNLAMFSFAVYRSTILSNRSGDFNYPTFYRDSASLAATNKHYEHFYFQPEKGTKVIISQLAKTWKYLFTFNSYILLFFSAFVYLSYTLYTLLFTSLFSGSSLTRRIQAIIVVLLLFSMSAVGFISGNLVVKQFEAKNQKQLSEKTQIILSELNSQFKLNQLFDETQYDLLNLKLKEYSRLFNTPISVFGSDGTLFNTSENKLYDLGLASRLANPFAYNELKNKTTSSVCVSEKAGTLAYLSTYTAILDNQQQLIGLINLPYFVKQSDLSNELSSIISGLINVYVILFVLSILAGIILSGYITQPLRLIQQQIAQISLGKKNEKILWNSQDEIGKLVFEYNQMLVKLEDSANQLAQSERESAWREMAKQVAHEIKNPLTPMKLNLQYLQHLIKNNPDDFAFKFEKASSGIIEQIDSLASIATEFSNFAKLPLTQLQTINLVEIISASTSLFENQHLHVIKNEIKEEQLLVKGDRDQCLRVFNNVIKNALQAVEEVAQPSIVISAQRNNLKVVICITDNGCGIHDSLKSKIFTPNFTTKSTGSGLGLAMVKNSMLGFGGDIHFQSQLNNGSTFYLEFLLEEAEKRN